MSESKEYKNYLSYSQVKKYRDCRYDWYHHYHEGLRLKEIDDTRLTIGTLGHRGLETAFRMHALGNFQDEEIKECMASAIEEQAEEYIEELTKGQELPEELASELEESIELAIVCSMRAIDWLNLERWEVVTVGGHPLIEHELVDEGFRVGKFEGFIGYVDVVLREKATGNVFLLDHKFRKSFKSHEEEETSEQFPIYQRLLEKFGVELSGIATFQIRTAVPAVPEMTKKGSLSKKRIITDWDTYLSAIHACGFNPADYEGVREWAEKNEFQRLTKQYCGEAQVANVWKGIEITAEEMSRDDLPIYRNLRTGFAGCHNCRMRELCLAELRGADTTWIRNNRYRLRGEDKTILIPADDEDEELFLL